MRLLSFSASLFGRLSTATQTRAELMLLAAARMLPGRGLAGPWLGLRAWLSQRARALAPLLLPGLVLYLALRPLLALLHELVVLLAADGLVLLGNGAARLASVGPLPFDPVYTRTLCFIIADVDVLGIAVAPPVGDLLRSLWPRLFTTPDLLADGAFASAVIGPGASVMARGVAVLSGDVLMLGLGLLLVQLGRPTGGPVGHRRTPLSANDGAGEAPPAQNTVWRSIRRRLSRGWLTVIGALVQAHVLINHLAARPASLADFEAAGLIYGFSVLFSGPATERPRLSALLGLLPDPLRDGLLVVIVTCLAYLLAGILLYSSVCVWRLLRRARPAQATGAVRLPRRGPIRLVLARSGLPAFAFMVAASPLGTLAEASSRSLDDQVLTQPAFVTTAPTPPDQVMPSIVAPAPTTVEQSRPAASPTADRSTPPGLDLSRPTPSASIQASARLASPPTVAVTGSDYQYAYLVDGEPTVIRGMGYNPVYQGLSAEERQALLARDFLEMRQAGVNTVLGWTTEEFDELLLDQAQQHGLGLILPFDLVPGLDYSDPDLRDAVRRDVLAWVARYRGHPAVRMWGIGNEVLHKLVYPSWMHRVGDPLLEARADAFAQWYVDLIDEIHRLDPDHPIIYRDAEEAYLPRMRTALNANGGPRPWFVYGINIYTPRLAEVLAGWSSQGLDVALLVSEFAPGGAGPVDRPRGYREMWGMIRGYPDQVLGGAPYVWTTEGPEEVDRVFGLVDGSGQPADGSLAMIGQMFHGEGTAAGRNGVGLEPCNPAVQELLVRTARDLQTLGGRTVFQALLSPSIMGPLDNLPRDPVEPAQLRFERADEPARLSWQRASGFEAEWWASWTPPSRPGEQLALLIRQRAGQLEIAYVYHGPGAPSPLAVDCPP